MSSGILQRAAKPIALALAAQHEHIEVLRQLLDAGINPILFNPDGYHPHPTPLHQAVWVDHIEIVRLLMNRITRLDIKDKIDSETALDWAEYGGCAAIAGR